MGRRTLKITADTNVLLRAFVEDDPVQSPLAQAALADAEIVVVPSTTLCEFAWVLSKSYRRRSAEIAAAIGGLMNTSKIVMDRPAISAGLTLLHAGGDFADGVMAYEGQGLGADTFVSFDRKAVSLLRSQGRPAHLLS